MNYNPYAAPQAPLPVPGGSAPFGQPQPWTPGEVISLAWERLKENAGVLVLSYFIFWMIAVVIQIPTAAVMVSRGLEDGTHSLQGVQAVTRIGGWIVWTFFEVGLTRIWLATARREPTSPGVLFSGADRFLPMLAVGFLRGFAVVVGFMLLVVPGIIAALGLSLVSFYVVDADMGPIDAMKASWEATRGQKGEILLLGLASFGIMLVGFLMCCVGTVVAVPLCYLALAVAYTRMSGIGAAPTMSTPQTYAPPGAPPGPRL